MFLYSILFAALFESALSWQFHNQDSRTFLYLSANKPFWKSESRTRSTFFLYTHFTTPHKTWLWLLVWGRNIFSRSSLVNRNKFSRAVWSYKYAMGRLFVIQYDQTPDSRIFLCNICHTQFALRQEVVSMVTSLSLSLFLSDQCVYFLSNKM